MLLARHRRDGLPARQAADDRRLGGGPPGPRRHAGRPADALPRRNPSTGDGRLGGHDDAHRLRPFRPRLVLPSPALAAASRPAPAAPPRPPPSAPGRRHRPRQSRRTDPRTRAAAVAGRRPRDGVGVAPVDPDAGRSGRRPADARDPASPAGSTPTRSRRPSSRRRSTAATSCVKVTLVRAASSRATCSIRSSWSRDRHDDRPDGRSRAPPTPDAICIEIAKLKATIVDLGELEPGTYTIARRRAAAITGHGRRHASG